MTDTPVTYNQLHETRSRLLASLLLVEIYGSITLYDLIPISMLGQGQMAFVRSVVGTPDDVHRLEEIGLRDGAQVEMLQPGSPCIIRFAGQKLCLRTDDLASVLVEPESAP